jgi:pimeloyl-ACP methyl ester carboxylesterase
MEKHAADLLAILEAEHIARCPFAGNSIGGYALFELWRRARPRVTTLILCDTKAPADTPEARATRLKSAADVLERGTELFFQTMLPKLLGTTTYHTRPDLVDGAMRMLQRMSAEDVAQVQRGMAERPDSVPTLNTIKVPTLIIVGEEDSSTGVSEAELMHQHIAGSRVAVVPKAGHYAPWEQPKEVGRLIRGFLDENSGQ